MILSWIGSIGFYLASFLINRVFLIEILLHLDYFIPSFQFEPSYSEFKFSLKFLASIIFYLTIEISEEEKNPSLNEKINYSLGLENYLSLYKNINSKIFRKYKDFKLKRHKNTKKVKKLEDLMFFEPDSIDYNENPFSNLLIEKNQLSQFFNKNKSFCEKIKRLIKEWSEKFSSIIVNFNTITVEETIEEEDKNDDENIDN